MASYHEYCKSYEAIEIELPEEGSKISFKNHNRSMRVLFFIDLLQMQILSPSHHSYQPANQTLRIATPISVRNTSQADFVTKKGFDDTLCSQQPATFVNEFNDDDVAEIFIDTHEKNIKEIYKKCKFPKRMIMTMHDELVYDNSTFCPICNVELGKDKVRDHCHLSASLEVLLMKSAT